MTGVRQVNEGFENFVESFEKNAIFRIFSRRGSITEPLFIENVAANLTVISFSPGQRFLIKAVLNFQEKGPLFVKHHYFCFCMSI